VARVCREALGARLLSLLSPRHSLTHTCTMSVCPTHTSTSQLSRSFNFDSNGLQLFM